MVIIRCSISRYIPIIRYVPNPILMTYFFSVFVVVKDEKGEGSRLHISQEGKGNGKGISKKRNY